MEKNFMSREEYLARFPKPDWASKQLIRWDSNGLVEDICEAHGVGHPNVYWLKSKWNRRKDGSIINRGIHTCCSCNCGYKYCNPNLEDFKDIPGFPGYMVNIDGDVWSTKTNCFMESHKKDGYRFIQFRVDGKPKYSSIHRLVALTWIPNPKNLPEVNHKDFDRSNNNISNLEWVTATKNIKHAYDNERKEKSRENCRNLAKDQRKFTIDEIDQIRLEHEKGATYKFLANKYDCHPETIVRICRFQTYKEK